MSAAAGSPPGTAGASPVPTAAPTPPAGEICPLCGAPLHAEQEWCLTCGAAARTRLAAAPNWKAPLVSAAVVVVLSLGVLAGALVKLAGNSGSQAPAITRTITTVSTTPAPTSTTPTTTAPTPTQTGTVPGSTTTGTTGATGGATPTVPNSVQVTPKTRLRILERLRKEGLLKAK